MRTIHKHVLLNSINVVPLRPGDVLRHVDRDGMESTAPVALWIETDESQAFSTVKHYRLDLVPTGGQVPQGAEYLGTVTGVQGWLVFHVYAQVVSNG